MIAAIAVQCVLGILGVEVSSFVPTTELRSYPRTGHVRSLPVKEDLGKPIKHSRQNDARHPRSRLTVCAISVPSVVVSLHGPLLRLGLDCLGATTTFATRNRIAFGQVASTTPTQPAALY